MPIVVLTAHRALEEAKELNAHKSLEAEDVLPVSSIKKIVKPSFAVLAVSLICSQIKRAVSVLVSVESFNAKEDRDYLYF